jgi:hypothetical protein
MIRRNVAGQVIYLPQLTTTDGTAITSSATLTVAKDGSEAGSGGTLAHVSNGVWKYTPTMAETDAAIVGLILTGTNAVPVVLNLVTTAANTAAVALGAVVPSDITTGNIKPVSRTLDDETPIRFVWPTDDATITAERSMNAGVYEATSGIVSFFRTEGNEHWYKLSYNAADREIGVVRYKLTDGTITRYVTLQVEYNSATTAIAEADVATKTKQDETIDLINAGKLRQDIKVI